MSDRNGREDEGTNADAEATSGLNRRGLLSAAAGGFALAASGLFLPAWLEQAAARPGASRRQRW